LMAGALRPRTARNSRIDACAAWRLVTLHCISASRSWGRNSSWNRITLVTDGHGCIDILICRQVWHPDRVISCS
jgi:hypothetical protein